MLLDHHYLPDMYLLHMYDFERRKEIRLHTDQHYRISELSK